MNGLIQRHVGVVADTGIKFYRDRSINFGTTALFDMSAGGDFGGGKNIIAGAQIKSLTYEDSVASFAKAHTYLNGGMVFARVSGDTFNLPENAAPQPGDRHWLVSMWLKIANYGAGTANSSNNQVFSFSTSNVNLLAGSMFGLAPITVEGAPPSAITIYARGRQYVITAALAKLFDGQLHQLAVECLISDDGTQQRVIVYLDQLNVFDSGWTAVAGTIPAAPTFRYIGTSAAFPVAWAGQFYRYRKDDLTVSQLTAAEVISADVECVGTRFS